MKKNYSSIIMVWLFISIPYSNGMMRCLVLQDNALVEFEASHSHLQVSKFIARQFRILDIAPSTPNHAIKACIRNQVLPGKIALPLVTLSDMNTIKPYLELVRDNKLGKIKVRVGHLNPHELIILIRVADLIEIATVSELASNAFNERVNINSFAIDVFTDFKRMNNLMSLRPCARKKLTDYARFTENVLCLIKSSRGFHLIKKVVEDLLNHEYLKCLQIEHEILVSLIAYSLQDGMAVAEQINGNCPFFAPRYVQALMPLFVDTCMHKNLEILLRCYIDFPQDAHPGCIVS